jgi:orotate phosphoribosyltransferase-like protein
MARTITNEKLELREHILTLQKQGWSEQRISDECSVPQQTVSYWLSHPGMKTPNDKIRHAQLMYAAGWPVEKIGEKLHESPSIIQRWAERHKYTRLDILGNPYFDTNNIKADDWEW